MYPKHVNKKKVLTNKLPISVRMFAIENCVRRLAEIISSAHHREAKWIMVFGIDYIHTNYAH